MVDNKTSHLALPLPDLSNMQDEDVPRIGGALSMLDAHAQQVDSALRGVDSALEAQGRDVEGLKAGSQDQAGSIESLARALETEKKERSKADEGAEAKLQALLAEQDNLDQRVDAAEQNITQQGTRLDAVESGVTALSTTLIGAVLPITCADSYVPNGCVPANGGEYTRAQFPTLYDTYLAGGKLVTCTYAAWTAQVAQFGNCTKFALDVDTQKFRVPMLKDGDSITQASSAAELGKSVNAGLPNITGTGMDALSAGDVANAANVMTGAKYARTMSDGKTRLAYSSGTTAYPGTTAIDASRSSSIYRNDVTTVLDEQVRLRHFVVLASAQNNASVFDWSAYMAALAGKANNDLSNVTSNANSFYFFALDQKASGVTGGATSSFTWHTRDLNTVAFNNIGASLSNNRVTLPAGRYYFRANVPAYATDNVRAALYDYTHGTYLALSPTVHANATYLGMCIIPLEIGEIVITAPTEFELRMYCQTAHPQGMGRAYSFGPSEKYSEIRIWKM